MSNANDFARASGRSVWMAKDIRKLSEWVSLLSAATLGEIDGNLASISRRNIELEELTAKDFPLPSMQTELQRLKQEVGFGRGFQVIRGLPADKYSLDQLKIIYWGIGSHFGTPMVQSHLGDMIGDIRDVSDKETDLFKRRGYRGNSPQAVHTDNTDIVSMLSVKTARTGGESLLASAHTVHNIMMDACPELLKIMYRGFYMRITDTDALAEGVDPLTPARIPTYMYTDGWLNCYFTRGYVDRAVLAGNVTLSPLEQAAVDAFRAISNHPDIATSMILQPGDMQFVNNRTVLHGRAEWEDYPELERRRHLLRLWLSVPEWPRMDKTQDLQGDESKSKWRAYAAKQRGSAVAMAS